MSRPMRKPTVLTQRKASTRISLSMPRRLTRTDKFRLLWTFCLRNHYSVPPETEWQFSPPVDFLFQESLLCTPWCRMCRLGLVCAGRSWSAHYAESKMLVFSLNGSNIQLAFVNSQRTDTTWYFEYTKWSNYGVWKVYHDKGAEKCCVCERVLS